MRNTRDYWSLTPRNYKSLEHLSSKDIEQYLNHRLRTTRHNNEVNVQNSTCINQNMKRIMTYDKYTHLRKYLKFGPTGLKNNPDPIYKIRGLISLMNAKFNRYYTASEWLSLDEGMIPFNGRKARFKVFNP